jgi:hypothetical protein
MLLCRGNNFGKNCVRIKKHITSLFILLSVSLFPVAAILEHRTSVKRFVSLQFLNSKTIGRTPQMEDQPVARPLPIQTRNKHRQTSMPWVGFEPTIPAFERVKTIHALNRAATVTGFYSTGNIKSYWPLSNSPLTNRDTFEWHLVQF